MQRITLLMIMMAAFTISSHAQNYVAIRNLLEVRDSIAMKQRNVIRKVLMSGDKSSLRIDSLQDAMVKEDNITLALVESLVSRYGWIGSKEIGITANELLFRAIQHADDSVRAKYYPIIKQAVEEHKALAADLALMEDRMLVTEHKAQKYGTQYKYDQKLGKDVIYPIDDVSGIEKRRRKVGLEPFRKFRKGKELLDHY